MKTLRKILKVKVPCGFLLFLMLSIGMVGCDKLLKEHEYSSQTVADFYKNKDEATLALSGVYNTLWSDYLQRCSMDNFRGCCRWNLARWR